VVVPVGDLCHKRMLSLLKENNGYHLYFLWPMSAMTTGPNTIGREAT
jgi:hypothetical protein